MNFEQLDHHTPTRLGAIRDHLFQPIRNDEGGVLG